MLKRLTRKFAPEAATLQQQWLLRRFGLNPRQVQLWSTGRRAVTRAAGLGILICFLPLPVHTLLALVVAVVWRLNAAVLVATTYVVNPLTLVPIYYGAFRVGSWALGNTAEGFAFELSWHWLRHGLLPVWKPLLLGCLVCGLTLGCATWLVLELAWRRNTRRKLQRRRQRVSR